jgi:hypothetical protein
VTSHLHIVRDLWMRGSIRRTSSAPRLHGIDKDSCSFTVLAGMLGLHPPSVRSCDFAATATYSNIYR